MAEKTPHSAANVFGAGPVVVGKVQAATVVLKNLKRDEKVSSELQARDVALNLEDAVACKSDRQNQKKGRNVEGRSTMREVMGSSRP